MIVTPQKGGKGKIHPKFTPATNEAVPIEEETNNLNLPACVGKGKRKTDLIAGSLENTTKIGGEGDKEQFNINLLAGFANASSGGTGAGDGPSEGEPSNTKSNLVDVAVEGDEVE